MKFALSSAVFLVLIVLSVPWQLHAAPEQPQSFADFFRQTTSSSLPGSAVDYWWWCFELHANISAHFSISAADSQVSTVEPDKQASAGFSAAIPEKQGVADPLQRTLKSLLESQDFQDPRSHNTDIRSRPRPRRRKETK